MRSTASIGLCLIISNVLVSAQSRTPEQRDWDWHDAHYPKALDLLMPVAKDGGTDNVVYRQHDSDGDALEQYFTIRETRGAGDVTNIDATVIGPAGATIYWQLLDMHLADRNASFESLVARITLRRQQLTAPACPEIRPRLDALSKVAFSVPTKDLIVLHPLVRRVMVDTSSGSIDASLYDDDHPLVRWGQTTFDALNRCMTNRNKRE